jgi:uncharacterized membrane protein
MAYLFLAAFAGVLFILLLQKLEHAETKLLVKTLKWTFVGVLLLAVFYLTLVGRLLHVAAIIILLIILLKKDAHTWMQERPVPLPLLHPMTKKEAAALLKVDLNASSEEVEAAFKKLKPKDSTEQDRFSQARDLLLKGKKAK